MDIDSKMEDKECYELKKRLEEAENCYKVFGFSHIIIIGSLADIMDVTFRKNVDVMFRKTKTHCKTKEETELYRQQLCRLYLTYAERALTVSSCLEPKLAQILKVEVDKPNENLDDKILALKKKKNELTKRIQSLLTLQSRMKTEMVYAEWIISKVEPSIYAAEKDIASMEYVSSNNVESILTSLSRMRNAFHSLEID